MLVPDLLVLLLGLLAAVLDLGLGGRAPVVIFGAGSPARAEGLVTEMVAVFRLVV